MSKGFTILEVILATFILTCGVAGSFALIQQTLSSVSASQSKLIASYLAQEGIEVAKNVRDSNWLEQRVDSNVSWDSGLSEGNWQIDFENKILPYDSQGNFLNIDSAGFYSYSSGSSSPFKRKISISEKTDLDGDGVPDKMKISAEVSWKERGTTRTVEAVDYLYNWYGSREEKSQVCRLGGVAQTCDGAEATALGCYAGDVECRRCDAGTCTYYTGGQHGCPSGYECDIRGQCVEEEQEVCSGVPDNTQVSGCDGPCQACQSGTCGFADSGTDPGSDCGTTSCYTGNCDGSGSCGYYTDNQQHNCSTCYACNASGNCTARTVDGASATALGCTAGDEACRRCDDGACGYYTSGQHDCSSGYECNASGSCELIGWTCGDVFVDSRDGKSYATVQIGDQCWMKQGLNVGTMIAGSQSQGISCSSINKYCYNDTEANCDLNNNPNYPDGGLYQWDQAMCGSTTPGIQGICPDGWHIPTDAEWCVLEQTVDPSITCDSSSWRGTDGGTKLKPDGSSGFEGNLAGYRTAASGSFSERNTYGIFWSSTHQITSYVWSRVIGFDYSTVSRSTSYRADGFSVRCVKDEESVCSGVPDNTQVSGCDGPCQACQSGTCGFADSGTDPGSDCTGAYSCSGFTTRLRNMCNGSGACADIDAAASDCSGTCASYCSGGDCVNIDTDFGTCVLSTNTRVVSGGDGYCSGGTCSAELVIDDFEDNNLDEYSYHDYSVGETESNSHTIISSGAYHGSYALKIDAGYTSGDFPIGGDRLVYSTSGLSYYPSQGDSFDVYIYPHYIAGLSGVAFGLQDINNYYLINVFNDSSTRLALFKLVSGTPTQLAGSWGNCSPPNDQWLRLHMDWASNGTITVSLYNAAEVLLTTINYQDTTFTQGGIGFRMSRYMWATYDTYMNFDYMK